MKYLYENLAADFLQRNEPIYLNPHELFGNLNCPLFLQISDLLKFGNLVTIVSELRLSTSYRFLGDLIVKIN